VLKPLGDAIAAGETVHAVLRVRLEASSGTEVEAADASLCGMRTLLKLLARAEAAGETSAVAVPLGTTACHVSVEPFRPAAAGDDAEITRQRSVAAKSR
jgi:hypothetical protein